MLVLFVNPYLKKEYLIHTLKNSSTQNFYTSLKMFFENILIIIFFICIFQEPWQKVGASKRRLAVWGCGALAHALVICACFCLYMKMSEIPLGEVNPEKLICCHRDFFRNLSMWTLWRILRSTATF